MPAGKWQSLYRAQPFPLSDVKTTRPRCIARVGAQNGVAAACQGEKQGGRLRPLLALRQFSSRSSPLWNSIDLPPCVSRGWLASSLSLSSFTTPSSCTPCCVTQTRSSLGNRSVDRVDRCPPRTPRLASRGEPIVFGRRSHEVIAMSRCFPPFQLSLLSRFSMKINFPSFRSVSGYFWF